MKLRTKIVAGFVVMIGLIGVSVWAGMTGTAKIIEEMRLIVDEAARAKRPAEVIGFMQGRLRAAYDVLNRHLEGRDWIVGEGPTAADFSCCGYLFYEEPFGFDRQDFAFKKTVRLRPGCPLVGARAPFIHIFFRIIRPGKELFSG